MPSQMEPEPSNESEAQRLVGQFLQQFALLEQALDLGIGKLLGLDGGKNDIVCSSIPFVKKLGVFFSAEGLLAAVPDQERKHRLKDVRSAILELNNLRVVFAHNPFSAAHGGGVSFRRVSADRKLEISNIIMTKEVADAHCARAMTLVTQVAELVSEMTPYISSFDFSDPRNSMYLALL